MKSIVALLMGEKARFNKVNSEISEQSAVHSDRAKIDIAIKLIKRMKDLFETKFGSNFSE